MTSHLIEPTEMYVRTVWELEEEGIPAMRARLVERLRLSAPSVSETVARLEDEGLLRLESDRTVTLTDAGRTLAESVMRKHRLAERLLVEVIELDWELVHEEACRWEHVISDEVERKLIGLLKTPTRCPHGNPIPGLAPRHDGVMSLWNLWNAAERGGTVRVEGISEQLQSDVELMRLLWQHGVRPGTTVRVTRDRDTATVWTEGRQATALQQDAAQLVYVTPV